MRFIRGIGCHALRYALRLFNRYSLQRVLLTVFSVIVALVTALAIVAIVDERTIASRIDAVFARELKLTDLAQRARSSYDQARLAESNYLLVVQKPGARDPQARYARLFQQRLNETANALTNISNASATPEIASLAEASKAAVRTYEERFLAAGPLRTQNEFSHQSQSAGVRAASGDYTAAGDAIDALLERLRDSTATHAKAAIGSLRHLTDVATLLVIVTAATAITVTCAAGTLILWYFRCSLRKLLAFSSQVEDGNEAARLSERARNELGFAARRLNSMAATVASTTRRLTDKAIELERANQLLAHRATHDGLTGLLNRSILEDRFAQASTRCGRSGRKLAVVLIDLDKFKWVNDSYGHHLGDEVLRETAARIRSTIRAEDTAARIGGDEFALLLEARDAFGITEVMERVRQRVCEPISFDCRTTIVSASCGVALFPDDGETLQALQRNADAALAKAKALGRSTLQFYSDELAQYAANRLELTQQLDTALERGELVLYYQPKVDLRTGLVCGVEALLRWHTPTGLVPPSVFVPVAEETGRIRAIGEWVLRAACASAKRLTALGFGLPVAINVSPNQFDDRDFLTRVQTILSECAVPAGLIELEITESVLMRDFPKAAEALHALKELGIQVSLDDFGTGYSNLSSLSRLPLQSLKIDRSLVADLSESRTGASILRTLVALARELGMKVVAEGVESPEQLRILARLSCDQIQGYFFSAPLPEDELIALLSEGRKLPQIEEFGAAASCAGATS